MTDLNEQLRAEFEQWRSEPGEEWVTFEIWRGGYEAARRSPASPAVQPPADLSAMGLLTMWRQAEIDATGTMPAPFQFAKALLAVAASTVPAAPAVGVTYLDMDGVPDIRLDVEALMHVPAGTIIYAGQPPAQPALQADAGADAKDAAHYKKQRDNLLSFIQNAPVGSGICCCGDDMQRHGDLMACGHNPVDQWDHSVICLTEEIEKSDKARALTSADEVKHGEEA